MKIAYFTNSRIPTEKAHGYQIAKMCEQFALAGLTVELYLPTRRNFISQSVFEFYNIRNNFKINKISVPDFIAWENYFGRGSYWLQSLFFLSKLAFLNIDKQAIVYTRNPEIAWLFHLKGLKCAYEAHRWPRFWAWLMVLLISKKQLVVANSQGTAAEFICRGYKNVLACPNGVDLADFELPENKEEFRRQLNLPLDQKLVMYLGHLYGWKGTDQIMEAAKELDTKADLSFVLIGGTDIDIEAIRKKLNNEKINNIVLLGRKKKEIVPNYLVVADVLLLTLDSSDREARLYTSPIKLFEYLASGVPVVAADLPSVRHLVSEREVVFYNPLIKGDLAEKIKQALTGPQESRIQAGLALAKEHTWSKRAEKIINFIHSGE